MKEEVHMDMHLFHTDTYINALYAISIQALMHLCHINTHIKENVHYKLRRKARPKKPWVTRGGSQDYQKEEETFAE